MGTEKQTNCGGKSVMEALASTNGTCAAMASVTTRTGLSLTNVSTGINVRFDYYNNQAEDDSKYAWRVLAEYMPAANVT